jgi:hypothetical protein
MPRQKTTSRFITNAVAARVQPSKNRGSIHLLGDPRRRRNFAGSAPAIYALQSRSDLHVEHRPLQRMLIVRVTNWREWLAGRQLIGMPFNGSTHQFRFVQVENLAKLFGNPKLLCLAGEVTLFRSRLILPDRPQYNGLPPSATKRR